MTAGPAEVAEWSQARKEAFRRDYVERRGYWAEFNDGLLEYSPEWLEAYLGYSSAPARCGPLSARMRELIYVAVDGSTTHMFTQGLEIHIGIALKVGCSAEELVEVLQLATMQGLDSVILGMTLLEEERPQGVPAVPAAEAALSRYGEVFGEVPQWLGTMARLAPDWVHALVNLLETAQRGSRLSAAERGLVRLALASSPTHLNEPAMRLALREALDAGASAEEIAQVFQLVAHLGLHACVDGIPAVVRAVGARGEGGA